MLQATPSGRSSTLTGLPLLHLPPQTSPPGSTRPCPARPPASPSTGVGTIRPKVIRDKTSRVGRSTGRTMQWGSPHLHRPSRSTWPQANVHTMSLDELRAFLAHDEVRAP